MKNLLVLVCALIAGVASADAPVVLSAKVRTGDPTILDVVYCVKSEAATVKVRAVAFENGYRSFNHVVRAETFVDDPYGKPTAQNVGDAVKPNVEHRLSWKDEKGLISDLAKCKFEILTSEQGELPMDVATIPATAGKGSLVVGCGKGRQEDVFTAMLWYYAAREQDLVLDDGRLTTTNNAVLSDGSVLANVNSIDYMLDAIEYIYDKMGYGLLNGALYESACLAMGKTMTTESATVFSYKREGAPESMSVGEKEYCVIDVSAGANATNYPVSYLDRVPTAGWGDEYRTTKILLRRIGPGALAMRNQFDESAVRPTAITKPFYIGVFEITQRQYELVVGKNNSEFKGAMRPVERVSWYDVRGWPEDCNWPSVKKVEADSFVGRLRARTGLSFDLPTEAQWEYACRGLTTGDFNNGDDVKMIARYYDSRKDGRGGYVEHATVGSYLPNLWGLYDMHGNVREWCLDWSGDIDTRSAVNDPVGPVSGDSPLRMIRGGTWSFPNTHCYSSRRIGTNPTYSTRGDGFRIASPAAGACPGSR